MAETEKPETVNPLTLSFIRSIEHAYGVYLRELHAEGKEKFAVHKKRSGEPKIGEVISDDRFFEGMELRLKLLKLPGMNPVERPHEWGEGPPSGC